jgi:membrane-bound metal-dependent hydrolase YbcI (DUF457 family)
VRAFAHAAIGAASSAAIVLAIKVHYPDARLPHPVFAGVVGAFAAGLPDVLEPATYPGHRQVCHSVAFAVLMAAALKVVYEWMPETEGQEILRDVLLSIGLGYLSHLGADATTAAGLPWFGRFQE